MKKIAVSMVVIIASSIINFAIAETDMQNYQKPNDQILKKQLSPFVKLIWELKMQQIIQKSLSEEVLDKTMNLFWEKGYFNTTVHDIIVATGFNRAALYKYFGGKDKLFLEMLQRFRKNITNHVTMPLQDKTNGIDGIKSFFSQFLELYETKNLRSRGCFLISTAADIHSHNKAVANFIDDFYRDITKFFQNLLLYSKDEGVLKMEVDIDSVADFLVGNLFGIMTLCRSSAPREIFENHVRGIVSFLSNISTTRLSK